MKPLSFICIALVFSTIYSLINCSVYGESCRNYGPLSFRFFSNHLLGFRKKLKCYSPAKVYPYWEKLSPLARVPFVYTVFPSTDLLSGE